MWWFASQLSNDNPARQEIRLRKRWGAKMKKKKNNSDGGASAAC
jgi:hypothetical protein